MVKIVAGGVFGVVIGFVAGLIGIGGGELRLPVLAGLFRLPIAIAAAANFAIGIIVATVSITKRALAGIMPPWDALPVILVMIPFSIAGAFIGALITGKVKDKPLRIALVLYLIAIGLLLLTEGILRKDFRLIYMGLVGEIITSAMLGFLIGVVCGLFGVAGGELRIPVFMYVFGLLVKEAGSASIIVSLPAQLSGISKHIHLKHLTREALSISIVMGIASIIGAYAGASVIIYVERWVLKVILGVILIFSSYIVAKGKPH